MLKEKFSLPLRPGLTSRNLGDSGDGASLDRRPVAARSSRPERMARAHPVLCFSPSAGFSHPRNPKISRTEPALMGVGEGEFLLGNVSTAESPQPGGANRVGFEKVLGEIAGGSAGPGHRLDGERRGAPAISPLDLSESKATERREDWGDSAADETVEKAPPIIHG